MKKSTRLNFSLIDPHIHQWDPYTTPHAAGTLVKLLGKHPNVMQMAVRLLKPKPLLDTVGDPQYALKPYLPIDYARDTADYQVDAVVHVEANWHHHDGFGVVEETKWIQQLPFGEQNIQLAGIVAAADPRDPNFKNILLAHQASSPVFKGIRKMAAWHADHGVYKWVKKPHLYTNLQFLKGFETLAEMDLSFDAWVYSNQLYDVTVLAKHFPETRLVLDHFATPVGVFGAVGHATGKTAVQREYIYQHWKEHISHLAELKNVYIKFSGLMMPVLGHRYFERHRGASVDEMITLLQPLVQHVIESFGTKRVIYASNYPMDKCNATLHDLMTSSIEMVKPFGELALQRIFRQNAIDFYRLNLK